MKNIFQFTTTLLILFSVSVFGQKKKKDSTPIDTLYARDIIEVKKLYPDILVNEMSTSDARPTESALQVIKSIKYSYPMDAKENDIQGKVYCRLLIDTVGNIFDIKIIKGLGGGCTEETLRALNELAKTPFKTISEPDKFIYQKFYTQFILR
jgi:hypothetical protein